jgi:hypothetical protein
MKQVIIDDVIESYSRLQNVWKVGAELGITGQRAHSILTKAGAINKMNYFTNEDKAYLCEHYKTYRDKGQLPALAKIMRRTVPFINRKAKALSLTEPGNPISMKPFAKEISARTKAWIAERGHPKGMKGKTHSDEFKANASKKSKEMWADPNSKLNSEEFKQKQSDHMAKMQASGKLNNNYSRVKSGTVEIAGRTIFFRSSWEANIAAYLQFQKENKLIKEWEFEVDVFWFESIKRGVRSYKPDFKITNNDDSQYIIEVKGWMDAKSKTKLKRMAKYYPEVKIELIDSKRYNVIKRHHSYISIGACLIRIRTFRKSSSVL